MNKGEVALWMWIAGLTVAGAVIFSSGIQMNEIQLGSVGRQMASTEFSELVSKARLACDAGEGTSYPYIINIADDVKAIYSADGVSEPPDKVSVLITRSEQNIGNYICIRYNGDDEPYCEEMDCDINMTYLGQASMEDSLVANVKDEMGIKSNSFELVIKKTDSNTVYIGAEEVIPIQVEPVLCGNGDVDENEECDTNGYSCEQLYGSCTASMCTIDCRCQVDLDCSICADEDQVCVDGSDWMAYCATSEDCISENPDYCNYEDNYDYSKNVITVARDGSGKYNCDGTADQAEINQALSEIASLGGGTVHLKAGTYIIDRNINIKSNTLLEGEEGTIVKMSPNADLLTYFFHRNAMIQYTGTPSNIGTNIAIKGFTLDGNADAFHPELFTGGVSDENVISQWTTKHVGGRGSTLDVLLRFNYVNNVVIDSMTMQNGLGDGVNLDKCSNLIYINNVAKDLGHDGVFYMRSNGGYIMNNDVLTRTNSAFRMLDTTDVKIGNNIVHSRPSSGAFQSTGPGIQIEAASNNVEIYNNVIRNLDGSGLWMPIGEGGTIRIHNNIIYDTGKLRAGNGYSNAGITTQGFNAIIEHNTIDEGGRAGIRIGSGTVTVKDNIIVESGVDVHPAGWTGTDPGAAIWNVGGTVTVQNNCLYNNIVNFLGTVTDGGGNIYQNPQFVNYNEQDYNLQSTSPCIGKASDGTDIGRYGGTDTEDDGICEDESSSESVGSTSNQMRDVSGTCDTSRAYNDQNTIYVAGDGSGDYNCDGNTCEEEINEAIAKVSSDSAYDTVFLKGPATYIISDTVNMKSNVILTGDTDAAIKLVNGANFYKYQPIIKGDGLSNVAIRCFEVDGNRDNNQYVTNSDVSNFDAKCGKYYYTMIHFTNSKNIEIDNMYLHHNWNDILKTQNCDNIMFHDNNVRQPGHDVVYAIKSENVWTYDNYIRIYCNSGIRPDGTKNIHIYGNDIARDDGAGGYAGIEIQGESTVWICDNNIHDVNSNIVDLSSGAATISYSGCKAP